MGTGAFYRGGKSLKPKPREVIIDRVTGLVQPARGVSVSSSPANLERFGGAYRLSNVPGDLQIVQIGRNPHHYEIIPANRMTWADYEEALEKIILDLVPPTSN